MDCSIPLHSTSMSRGRLTVAGDAERQSAAVGEDRRACTLYAALNPGMEVLFADSDPKVG